MAYGNRATPNSPEGRKKLRIIGAAIAIAAVLAIAGSLVGDRHLTMKLFGVAAGIALVAVVYVFSNRRAR